MEKTARLLLIVLVAFAGAHRGVRAGAARLEEPQGQAKISGPPICTCDAIRAAGVAWCDQHWRGYAYGHVLRTPALCNTLLPEHEDPNATPCPACGHRPPVARVAAKTRADHNHPEAPQFQVLTETKTLGMVNALQTCSVHSDQLIRDIPGYCPVCRRSYVNGKTARSWVFAALEPGQLLPALEKVAPAPRGRRATQEKPTPDPEAAPTTQPAGAEAPQSLSPAARAPTSANEAQVSQNHPPTAREPGPANGAQAPPASTPLVPGCEDCKRAFEAGAVLTPDGFPPQPFCEKCGIGVVAGRVFMGREAYELARAADAALAYKRLSRCEICGVGILTGQHCNICKQCRNCHAP